MTRIVVAAKQDQTLLQDTQSKSVILDRPSIIQIGVTQQDVKTLEQSGDKLIVTLKNGEQIVLEGFFQTHTTTVHSLAFPKADGTFSLAQFDETGKFTHYTGLQKLDSLLYEGANTVPAQQLSAYESTSASSSDFSISELFSSSAAKAGLGVLSAIGLGLALIDNGDNKSSSPPDITAPKTPTATINAEGTKISGTAEAGATIYVVDKNEKVIVTVKVDKDGQYSVTLPEALVNNNSYYVKAKDDAGNSSGYTQVTGTKDTIAPVEPQAQLNDQGNIVTGKSEANAIINVYDASGSVEAVDAAGNKSEQHKIELGKDTIAPDQPKYELNKEGTSILGTAEANAKVIIQDSTGVVIATGKIIIEDAAGNQSKAIEIKPGQDLLAPEKPVASLNAEGTIITGTAEANSKITVYDSANKLLGTATTDANGNYTVTLSSALTEAVGSVYATDAAGNQSAVTSVTGTKDVTPPASPKITDVVDDVGESKGSIAANGNTDDKRPVISGTGEAGATLIIYDNNKAVGKLRLGAHSITSVQTDKAGNTSLMSDARSFTVVEVGVKAALADEYSVMDQNSADSHASLASNSLSSNIVNAELNPDSNANRDFLLQSMPPHTETNRVDLTSENIAKLLQTAAETDGSIQTHLDTDHKTSVNDLFLDASVLEPKEQQIEDVIESAMKHSATTSENIMNSTSETVDQYMNNLPNTTIFPTDAIAEITIFMSDVVEYDQFQISLDATSSLNFTFQQNAIPLIRHISLTGSKQLSESRFIIESHPAFFQPTEIRIGKSDKDQNIYLSNPKLNFDLNFLLHLNENIKGYLNLKWLDSDDQLLAVKQQDIEVLTVDTWGGEKQPLELLACFSQPNAASLAPILKRASEYLVQKNLGSLNGYSDKSPEQVLNQLNAIWQALNEQNLHYIVNPASYIQHGQRIRFAKQILDEKMACCLDSTMLMSSLIEQIGLDPIVMIVQGHSFIGVWLHETPVVDVLIGS
ncbi:hypothetical protein FQR65_LT18780 [Abscondita terminalis]|nr:hypothetical protein FQR65_LT18780 [Abscondita terminalis]